MICALYESATPLFHTNDFLLNISEFLSCSEYCRIFKMGDPRPFSSTQIVDPALFLSENEIRQDNIIMRKIFFPTSMAGIIWCAKRKLLKNSCDCEGCCIPMTFSRNSRLLADGFQWMCKLCKKSKSLRKGSCFESSHLTLSQILIVMYGWANECPQDFIAKEAEIGLTSHTVIDWYNFCREVCETYFIQNEIAIGGLNEDGTSKIVEIDESKFFPRKYHQGRWVDGHWVFGGIERGTKKCFMVEVPDRTEATLAAVIQRHILPGTIIMSDGWRAYHNLNTIGGGIYEHQVIIQEENFVDPDDATIYTQSVVNMWMRAKRKLRRQFGTSEALFTSYLHDFVWRNQYPKNQIFEEFLLAVAAQYPVA